MNNQEQAFEKLSRLKVGALFMEMGTGKTKVALDLVNSRLHKVDYVLWICPCSLKAEIEAERQKWHPGLQMDIVGCESIGQSDRKYLEVRKKVTESRAFIVVDESLKIKNRLAKRTMRIIELGKFAAYKLILNGTPISKSYCDLWAQMEFLSPKILGMSWTMFYNTYCEYYTRGKYKGKIRGFVNIPHLIDKISPYVFECALEIETTKNKETFKYKVNESAYEEYKNEIFQEYYNGEELNFNAFAMKLQMFYTEHSERDKVLFRVIEQINDRVIVFVRFLQSIPPGAHRITGAEKERDRIIQQFKQGDFKVLWMTYGCGAFGLNLQFCKNMIFAEHTWDYAVREQAEARIYRMGQGSEVNYYDIVCENAGLEKLISGCISRKEDMLKTVKQEIQKCGAKEFVKCL